MLGVHRLPLVTLGDVLQGNVPHQAVKIQYSSNKDFEKKAKQLKLMSDLRVSGINACNHLYYVYSAGWCTTNGIQRNR